MIIKRWLSIVSAIMLVLLLEMFLQTTWATESSLPMTETPEESPSDSTEWMCSARQILLATPAVPSMKIVPEKEELMIPGRGETETHTKFEAVIEDQYGNPVDDHEVIQWTVSPRFNDKVSMRNGEITVSAGAGAGEYTLTAVCGDLSASATLTLFRSASITPVPLGKTVKIPPVGAKNITIIFDAVVRDKSGAVVENPEIVWELDSESHPGIHINHNIVTITSAAIADRYGITATCGDLPPAMAVLNLQEKNDTDPPVLQYVNISPQPQPLTIPTVGANSISASFSVTAEDQYGHPVTDLSDVTWRITPQTPGVSIHNGTVSVTSEATAGDYTITAICESFCGQAVLTLTDPPVIQSVSISPEIISLDIPAVDEKNASISFTATVKDQHGNTVNAPDITWQITPKTPGVSVEHGTVTVTSDATEGDYIITATCGSVPGKATLTLQKKINTDPPVIQSVSISPKIISLDIPAGDEGNASTSFTATVKDQHGNTINAPDITWQITPKTSGVSVEHGTVTVTSDATEGDYIITATCGSVPGKATLTLQKKINTDPPVIQSVSISPEITSLDIPAGDEKNVFASFTATVKDQHGNTVNASDITWQITPKTSGVSVEHGTVTVTSDATEGDYILTATCGNVPGKATLTLQKKINTDPPVAQSISISPEIISLDIPAGDEKNVFASFTATVKDQHGNTVNAPDITWQITPKTSGVSVEHGTVTVTPDAAEGNYTITALCGEARGEAILTLKQDTYIEPPAAQSVGIFPEKGTLTIPTLSGSNTSTSFFADVQDQHGNALDSSDVIWQITPQSSAIHVSNGVVIVTPAAIAGTYTVTATYGEVWGKATLILTAPPAAQSVSISPKTQVLTIPANGASNAVANFAATVRDQYDNPMNVSGITWKISPENSAVSINNGTLTVTYEAIAGTYEIFATYGNLFGKAILTLVKETNQKPSLPAGTKVNIIPESGTVYIPTNAEKNASIRFTAEVTNGNNQRVNWSITSDPSLTGVYINQDGVVTVASSAIEGSYMLVASCNGEQRAALLQVKRTEPILTRIDITEQAKSLTLSPTETINIRYTAVARDQYGVVMPEKTILWNIISSESGSVSGMSIENATGCIHVTPQAQAGTYTIQASCEGKTAEAFLLINRENPVVNHIRVTTDTPKLDIPGINETVTARFSAVFTDQYQAVMPTPVTGVSWRVTNDRTQTVNQGFLINNGLLLITPVATPGVYYIYVEYEGLAACTALELRLNPRVKNITISSAVSKVRIPDTPENVPVQFYALLTDQYAQVISEQSIYWTVASENGQSVISGLTIDQTGLLHITSDAIAGQYYIMAFCGEVAGRAKLELEEASVVHKITLSSDALSVRIPGDAKNVETKLSVMILNQYQEPIQAAHISCRLLDANEQEFTCTGISLDICDAENICIRVSSNATAGNYWLFVCCEEISTRIPLTLLPPLKLFVRVDGTYVYNGRTQTPNIHIALSDGTTLSPDSCEIHYYSYSDSNSDSGSNAGNNNATEDLIHAGSVMLEVTHEDYGSASTVFTILPRIIYPDITLAQCQFEYTGKAITPKVLEVSDPEDHSVIPPSEYQICYDNRIAAGTGAVTIIDNPGGNYTVNGIAAFQITEPLVCIPDIDTDTHQLTLHMQNLPLSWNEQPVKLFAAFYDERGRMLSLCVSDAAILYTLPEISLSGAVPETYDHGKIFFLHPETSQPLRNCTLFHKAQ